MADWDIDDPEAGNQSIDPSYHPLLPSLPLLLIITSALAAARRAWQPYHLSHHLLLTSPKLLPPIPTAIAKMSTLAKLKNRLSRSFSNSGNKSAPAASKRSAAAPADASSNGAAASTTTAPQNVPSSTEAAAQSATAAPAAASSTTQAKPTTAAAKAAPPAPPKDDAPPEAAAGAHLPNYSSSARSLSGPRSKLRTPYPPIEPYKTGTLKVSSEAEGGHEIYWELSGKEGGYPSECSVAIGTAYMQPDDKLTNPLPTPARSRLPPRRPRRRLLPLRPRMVRPKALPNPHLRPTRLRQEHPRCGADGQHDVAPRRRHRASAYRGCACGEVARLWWVVGIDAVVGVCAEAPREGVCVDFEGDFHVEEGRVALLLPGGDELPLAGAASAVSSGRPGEQASLRLECADPHPHPRRFAGTTSTSPPPSAATSLPPTTR